MAPPRQWQQALIVIQRIEFEINTDKLLEDSKQYLDQLVTFMQLQPQCYVRIIGHTDDVGFKTYNQTLSEKGAVAVMKYLISKGIEEKIIIRRIRFG